MAITGCMLCTALARLDDGLVISAEYRIEYIYCIIVDQSVQSTVNIGPDISKLNQKYPTCCVECQYGNICFYLTLHE